jgi:hypothetical protein
MPKKPEVIQVIRSYEPDEKRMIRALEIVLEIARQKEIKKELKEKQVLT